MEKLLTALKAKAKKPIENMRKTGIFYATSLKIFKNRFWEHVYCCLYENEATL